MASPNSTFTEMVTTTLRNHKREIADNVSNHNSLLRRMNEKGNLRVLNGGYEIVEPLDYAENSTYQRYSGFEVLNVAASDVLSAAKYDWKQSAIHVVASGRELRMNNGREQLINLAKARLTNAMRTFRNNLSTDIWSDGTSSNQIGGVQAVVSDAGTGTVGGINSSTYTFWKSILQSAASPLQGGGAITPSKSTIQSLMLPLWLDLIRGGDRPDLIVADSVYFTYYEESLTDVKRYMHSEEGQGGFISLKYKSADVVYDDGCPASHMYMFNTDYLKFVAHRDANLTEVEEKVSINQDGVVIPVLWMGNLTCSNRSLQGVIKA
jgi:hypothetical protein